MEIHRNQDHCQKWDAIFGYQGRKFREDSDLHSVNVAQEATKQTISRPASVVLLYSIALQGGRVACLIVWYISLCLVY